MTSLKEVRDQLLLSHDESVLNDLCLPYDSYPDFTFDDTFGGRRVRIGISLPQKRFASSRCRHGDS